MKRIAMILLGVLTLPAYGGIASQEYVDSELGNVSTTISTKADKTGYAANMLLQTKDDGKLTATTLKTGMIENGAVTNSKLASGIGLDKLDMGTLPASGKHILIWNSATSKYVFEELMGLAEIDLDAISEHIDSVFTMEKDFTMLAYSIKSGVDGCVGMRLENGEEIPLGHYKEEGGSCADSEFAGMSIGEWKFIFPDINTELKGLASCSSSTESAGSPNRDSFGQHCWCKMTAPAESSWIYAMDVRDESSCMDGCQTYCVQYPEAKNKMFNSAKQ